MWTGSSCQRYKWNKRTVIVGNTEVPSGLVERASHTFKTNAPKMLEKFNRYKRRQRLTTAELRQKVQILSASTIRNYKLLTSEGR